MNAPTPPSGGRIPGSRRGLPAPKPDAKTPGKSVDALTEAKKPATGSAGPTAPSASLRPHGPVGQPPAGTSRQGGPAAPGGPASRAPAAPAGTAPAGRPTPQPQQASSSAAPSRATPPVPLTGSPPTPPAGKPSATSTLGSLGKTALKIAAPASLSEAASKLSAGARNTSPSATGQPQPTKKSVPGLGSRSTGSAPDGGQTSAEAAKSVLADTAMSAAQGAVVGGGLPGAAAGAAKGFAKSVLGNKKTRWKAITALIVIPCLPIVTIVGIVAATTALGGAISGQVTDVNNDATVASINASGYTSSQIDQLIDPVLGQMNFPWVIYLASYRLEGTKLNISAMNSALRKADSSGNHSDMTAGTIYDSTGKLAAGTSSSDKSAAAAVQDVYVQALMTAVPTDKGTATNIYKQALSWELGQSAASCTTGSTTLTGSTGSGAGATAATLSIDQIKNAQVIIGVGKTIWATTADQQQAAVVGIATAMQESHMTNLPGGDRDSVGMFQQRPSQGWGTPAQIIDPVYSTSKFFSHLVGLAGWQTMPVTVAAQKVQGSAFPDAYAKWEALARAAVAAHFTSSPAVPIAAGVTIPGHTAGGSAPGNTSSGTSLSASCTTSSTGGLAPGDPGPSTTATGGGFTPDTTKVEGAIAFAESQLGKPYVFGGAGPNGWDCSGLTMKAYAAVGIDIGAHDVHVQLNKMSSQNRVLPYAERQRGDLLFWHDGSNFYHVGIYLGNDMMVAAPKEGDVVKIQQVWGTGATLYNYVARPSGTVK